jgi:hypothetical protein
LIRFLRPCLCINVRIQNQRTRPGFALPKVGDKVGTVGKGQVILNERGRLTQLGFVHRDQAGLQAFGQ